MIKQGVMERRVLRAKGIGGGNGIEQSGIGVKGKDDKAKGIGRKGVESKGYRKLEWSRTNGYWRLEWYRAKGYWMDRKRARDIGGWNGIEQRDIEWIEREQQRDIESKVAEQRGIGVLLGRVIKQKGIGDKVVEQRDIRGRNGAEQRYIGWIEKESKEVLEERR